MRHSMCVPSIQTRCNCCSPEKLHSSLTTSSQIYLITILTLQTVDSLTTCCGIACINGSVNHPDKDAWPPQGLGLIGVHGQHSLNECQWLDPDRTMLALTYSQELLLCFATAVDCSAVCHAFAAPKCMHPSSNWNLNTAALALQYAGITSDTFSATQHLGVICTPLTAPMSLTACYTNSHHLGSVPYYGAMHNSKTQCLCLLQQCRGQQVP